jgi:hypothetical protein
MMEAAKTYKKLVNFYLNTRRYNPEDSHLHVEISQSTSDSDQLFGEHDIVEWRAFVNTVMTIRVK